MFHQFNRERKCQLDCHQLKSVHHQPTLMPSLNFYFLGTLKMSYINLKVVENTTWEHGNRRGFETDAYEEK